MPADIVGTQVLVTEDDSGRRRSFRGSRQGPVFTRSWSSPTRSTARRPKTQSALLEAMQERQVTVGGRTRSSRRAPIRCPRSSPFFVSGRRRTLLEHDLVRWRAPTRCASWRTSSSRFYVAELVEATHPHDAAPDIVRRYARFGASPRGAQALILGAKATALLDGRPSVAAADVAAVAPSALQHRIGLSFEAAVDGVAARDVVSAVLDHVSAAPSV
jgi:MoxR-like ATPase